jgi:DNA polymerase/3'-5' exonuclease PolX
VSAGVAIGRETALRVACDLVRELRPSCVRIEIAGSLRRGKPEVHDIELVAVPRTETLSEGLFGEVHRNLLDWQVATMVGSDNESDLQARLVENRRANGSIEVQRKLGSAFKALVYLGIPVDLFAVIKPASWGVIFGLRTGPGDWNIELVTRCKEVGRRVAGGQVEAWHSASSSWRPVPTPEEADFFRAIGQPWVEPAERSVERVRITRPET